MSSILASTKELLGIPSEVTDYDVQLVIAINSAVTMMNQLGVVTDIPVVDSTDTLEDLLPEDEEIYSLVQMYIYTKVRITFDPPSTSFVLAALEKTITEYEWRLSDYS